MPSRMSMPVFAINNHHTNSIYQHGGNHATRVAVQQGQIQGGLRSGGGLGNMGMVNRIRFTKAGCSSCGGR
jgi:hypothetical protein